MLVTLARFLDPWEAYVVRARLDADGIPATVAFANHVIANWPISLALGGTSVQVPASFLGQSRQILSDYSAGALESVLNEQLGLQSERCLRCTSMNFQRTMPLRERLSAIAIILFLAVFPTRCNRFICKDCGYQWEWGEGEG